MSYVVVGILLLLLAAGFITYLVMTATKRSSPAREGGSPGIGSDDAPLGDTEQHAGEQSSGQTTSGADAEGGASEGGASAGGDAGTRPDDGTADAGRFQRDPIGGEGEGSPYVDSKNT